MHKFLKTTLLLTVVTLLFGTALSSHAQTAPATDGAVSGALNAAFPILGPISTAVGSGTGPLFEGIVAGAGPLGALAAQSTGIGGSFLGWIGLKGIGYVLFVISYIAGAIGSFVFTIAGLLVEFGLYLNTTILDGEVVQLGWRFCRDLANLGFTIGIIVIAYATMLGYESYGIKKLIINFAFAAVIVNFSFSIAGFAIDMSNMLTHFFVNAAIGGEAGGVGRQSIHKFTETLASAFSPQKLLVTNTGNMEVYQSLSSNDGMIAAVLSIFFVALFTAFAALGMLMVGLTTISRFVYLSGLIIIMPLATLCYAFPNTKKYSNDWYKQFTCQLTYLPAATFTMYIVIMFVQVKSNIGYGSSQAVDLKNILDTFEAAKNAPGGLTPTKTLEIMATPFKTITDMVLVLTMLFYGITKSRNIGCAGGGIALKWMEGLKDWAIGAPRGTAEWAGRKYLSGGGTKPEENRGTRLANALSSIPLVRRLVPRLNNFTKGTSKNLGNLETQYKGYGDVQLRNAIYNPDIKLSAEDMAAAAKEAVLRGLINNPNTEKSISQEKLDEFIPALKRYGFDEDVIKKTPYLYNKFGWNLEKDGNGEYVDKENGKKFDAIMKGYKPEDIETFTPEILSDLEVVQRLSGAQLEKIPKGDEHRKAFTNTILRLRGSMTSEKFDAYMGKAFGKAEAADALTPDLLKNKDIVRNLNNAHLKRFSGADKKKQRDEILNTLNRKKDGEYELGDEEFAKFMKNNFAKGKDIADINPDILRNERVFSKLQGSHVAYLQAEPDTNQQLAIIQTLRKEYLTNTGSAYEKNMYSEAKAAHLDELAATIVKNKDNPIWSIITNDEVKDDFLAIENEYHSRHPDENPKPKNKNQQQKNKPDDADPYGPSAPPAPTQGPYPSAGGGPSSGNTPPKPPLPPMTPKSPYPAGAGGPSTPTPPLIKQKMNPEPPERSKGFDIGKTIDRAFSSMQDDEIIEPTETQKAQEKNTEQDQKILNALQFNKVATTSSQPTSKPSTPPPTPPPSNPITPLSNQTKKGIDVGAAIDAALKNTDLFPSEVEINDEFPKPLTAEQKAFEEKRAKLRTQITSSQNTPPPSSLTPEFLASLEAATNPQPAAKPTGTPITPPELDVLATQETERIKTEGRGWQPPEPIDAVFEPKSAPASEPLKRITYQGPLTLPEQKPASVPEPIKTIMERERNANENQISVIPKFMPADQPRRIEYKGPVTPPPTPAIPEPIRSFLQKEKNENDNQVERKNNL